MYKPGLSFWWIYVLFYLQVTHKKDLYAAEGILKGTWYILTYIESNLRPSWLWLYDSRIYNYLCNKCLSPLKLRVQIPLMARCTRYNIMWSSFSTAGQWFTLVSSTNKTDCNDVAAILLKVALNTITLTLFKHTYQLKWW